jgi:hypothetical protein
MPLLQAVGSLVAFSLARSPLGRRTILQSGHAEIRFRKGIAGAGSREAEIARERHFEAAAHAHPLVRDGDWPFDMLHLVPGLARYIFPDG